MSRTKNVSYIANTIDISVLCHRCKEKIPTPSGGDSWDRNEISNAYFRELECGSCGAFNRFPAKIQNAFSG